MEIMLVRKKVGFGQATNKSHWIDVSTLAVCILKAVYGALLEYGVLDLGSS